MLVLFCRNALQEQISNPPKHPGEYRFIHSFFFTSCAPLPHDVVFKMNSYAPFSVDNLTLCLVYFNAGGLRMKLVMHPWWVLHQRNQQGQG